MTRKEKEENKLKTMKEKRFLIVENTKKDKEREFV